MSDSLVSNTINPLKQALALKPIFPGGIRRVCYPTATIDLKGEVARHLTTRGVTDQPLPLETLQLRVSAENQIPKDGPLSPISLQLEFTEPGVQKAYRKLVGYLAQEVLGFDVVFERSPFLRFHFPARLPDKYRSTGGVILAHHSDTLLGDYFEQINCWLPLSTCAGTRSLQIASFDDSIGILTEFGRGLDFDLSRFAQARQPFYDRLYSDDAFQQRVLQACHPLETQYGEVVLFDPRTIHATAENLDTQTRVSIDFRLIPLTAYNEIMERFRSEGKTPVEFEGQSLARGGYFDVKTAFEALE